MVAIDILYEGGLHCRLTHGPSGSVISTDAPKDNNGKGEAFSPSDMVAAALGACMLTIMGIYAARHGIELAGARTEVLKEMIQQPERRIGKLTLSFEMPAGIAKAHRAPLERAALACPVHKSLNPEIEIPVSFRYPD